MVERLARGCGVSNSIWWQCVLAFSSSIKSLDIHLEGYGCGIIYEEHNLCKVQSFGISHHAMCLFCTIYEEHSLCRFINCPSGERSIWTFISVLWISIPRVSKTWFPMGLSKSWVNIGSIAFWDSVLFLELMELMERLEDAECSVFDAQARVQHILDDWKVVSFGSSHFGNFRVVFHPNMCFSLAPYSNNALAPFPNCLIGV